MYFIPKLANGKKAPLPWQLRLFFFNANWPMAVDASWLQRFIDKFSLFATFLSLTVIVESEFNFILKNRHNLGLVLETLATSLVSTELFLRILNMAYKRNEFKLMIGEFYANIYIECTPDNKSLYDEVQFKSRPTRICSYTYFTTLFTMFATPIIGFFSQQQLFPYRMHLHYDFHPWAIYVPTLLAAFWAGFVVVTQMVAEANLLASLILNLNGRYLLLQRDLRELYEKTKKCADATERTRGDIAPATIVTKFHEGLVEIMKRNFKLNQFARQMQEQYSFRIFILMGLSALLLCVLGFKVVTVGINTKIITYATWICTKTVELVVFGELGSTIIATTDRMSIAYYQSNWEELIQHSDDVQQNKQLMKLLAIAIELNQNPICFTGFNFFQVSLSTVITILRGAGSYFTCLYAFY